jgi:hypothetical protein
LYISIQDIHIGSPVQKDNVIELLMAFALNLS